MNTAQSTSSPYWGKFFVLFLLMILQTAADTVGQVTLQVLVVKRLGMDYLPLNYIGLNLLNILGALSYVALMRHLGHKRLMILYNLLSVVILLFTSFALEYLRTYSSALPPQMLFVVGCLQFVDAYLCEVAQLQVWILCGEAFLPRISKKLFPLFGLGAILGNVFGGGISHYVPKFFGMHNMPTTWAFLILLSIPLILFFFQKWSYQLHTSEEMQKSQGSLSSSFRHLFSVKFGRNILLIGALFFALYCFVDFQFTDVMNAHFSSEESLSSLFGIYNAAINTSSGLLQFFAGEKILMATGVMRALFALPAISTMGFFVMIFSFGFWPWIIFRFLVDLANSVLQVSSFQLALNAFEMSWRSRMRILVDTFCVSGGIFAGIILFTLRNVLSFASHDFIIAHHLVNAVSSLFSCLGLFLTVRTEKAYFEAIALNIEKGSTKEILDALESLAEKTAVSAIPVLHRVVTEKATNFTHECKLQAIKTIGHIGAQESYDTLLKLLQHDNEALKTEALKLLSEMPVPFSAQKVALKREVSQLIEKEQNPDIKALAEKILQTK